MEPNLQNSAEGVINKAGLLKPKPKYDTTDHPFSIPTLVSVILSDLNNSPQGMELNEIDEDSLSILLQYNLCTITQFGKIAITDKGKKCLTDKIVVVYPFSSGTEVDGTNRTMTVNNYNLSLLSMSSNAASAFLRALTATATTFFHKITSSHVIQSFIESLYVSGVFSRVSNIELCRNIRGQLENNLYQNPTASFLNDEYVKISDVISQTTKGKLEEASINNKVSLPKIALFNPYVYSESLHYDSGTNSLLITYVDEEGEKKQMEFDQLNIDVRLFILQSISSVN
jgi:hypothetical protein